MVNARAAVHQRDARACPVQFQRGDGGRVLRTDDDDVLIVVRMRLFVVVDHLLQLFARHVKHVRHVVISGG